MIALNLFNVRVSVLRATFEASLNGERFAFYDAHGIAYPVAFKPVA